MTTNVPIIRKLQMDALNREVPVSDLLRLAKVIATKLSLTDALVWIDRELDGYLDVKMEELPNYRQLTGYPKVWNPYHGWQPIHFEDADDARFWSQAPLGQALSSVEEILRRGERGRYSFPYSPERKTLLMKAIGLYTDVTIFLDYGRLWGVVDAVRNLILNWSLELEKAGVLGEAMAFTAEERREAGPVSQQFIIQNVGVLGNVEGRARVTNKQSATVTIAIDLNQVRDFATQARAALPLLPDTVRETAEHDLASIDAELANSSPNTSKIRSLLGSIKNACEGAAGNLAAEGILGLIGSILV